MLKPVTIHWDVTNDNTKRVKAKTKRTPVMEFVDNITHAVVVHYSELKILGAGWMKDYFILALHPCCLDALKELKAKGFRNSKSYPGFVLEYTMTEQEIAWFKANYKDHYELAQNYPGKIYETKFESFREVYKSNKPLISQWRIKEAARLDEIAKQDQKAMMDRKHRGNGDN